MIPKPIAFTKFNGFPSLISESGLFVCFLISNTALPTQIRVNMVNGIAMEGTSALLKIEINNFCYTSF